MVVRTIVEARCHRGIGQHHVYFMDPQGRQQVLESSFAANKLHGLVQIERGFEQALSDLFWQDIVDPHDEPQGSLRGSMSERIE